MLLIDWWNQVCKVNPRGNPKGRKSFQKALALRYLYMTMSHFEEVKNGVKPPMPACPSHLAFFLTHQLKNYKKKFESEIFVGLTHLDIFSSLIALDLRPEDFVFRPQQWLELTVGFCMQGRGRKLPEVSLNLEWEVYVGVATELMSPGFGKEIARFVRQSLEKVSGNDSCFEAFTINEDANGKNFRSYPKGRLWGPPENEKQAAIIDCLTELAK